MQSVMMLGNSPVKRAFQALGGVTKTAKAITLETGMYVTSSTAQMWLKRDMVPLKYMYALVRLSGIPAEDFIKHAAARKGADD